MINQEPAEVKGHSALARRLVWTWAAFIALLVAGCGGPASEIAAATPASPPPPSEAGATQVLPTPSPTPTATASAVPSATPTPTVESRALRDLKPGEQLSLVAEIPVLRVTFGLRTAFDPNHPIVYHTGVGPQVEGFDLQLGQTVFQLTGFPLGAPLNLEISPAGDRLIAEDGPSLRVLQLPAGELLTSLQMPSMFFPMSSGFIGADTFYAADSNGNVAMWDIHTWEERSRMLFPSLVDAVFALPSEEGVVILPRGEAELKLVDWSGTVLRSVRLPAAPWRLVGTSPDGDRALLHVDRGKRTEGVLIISLTDPERSLTIPLVNIRELAVSDDWGTLAVTDVSELLRLYDPQTGAELYQQQLDAFQVMGLSLSADGSLLAVHARLTNSNSGLIQVWGRPEP